MRKIIQEILEDMKEISRVNALYEVDKLSETEKKCSRNVPMIRDITSDFFRSDKNTKHSIGEKDDFIEHLVPTILKVGFCGELAYRFILEYFRKTGQTNISLVLSLQYPFPQINHTFVIIGTNLEEKVKGLGYTFKTVFQEKCSKQDILVDPLTGKFCEIADRQGLQQFIDEYQAVSYVNTVCSYHSKNILQQVINHDAAILELAKKVRCKFNADKLSEILRLYLQKEQENKVFCLLGDDVQELLIIPDDLSELNRIKNYFMSAGICNATEIKEVTSRALSNIDNLKVILKKSSSTKCLIISKINNIDLDLVIYKVKQKIEESICLPMEETNLLGGSRVQELSQVMLNTNAPLMTTHDHPICDQVSKTNRSLQQPTSFFYHPHRMINERLVLGCDAPTGSIIDPKGRTLVPSNH